MATKKTGNSIFSWEQEAGIDSPLGNWRKQPEQKLSIKYVSCNFDETHYKIKFLISNTGLANKEAELFFYEHNEVFSNTSLAIKKIKLTHNPQIFWELKIVKSKIDNLNTNFEYGGFEFEASITCNGLSAKSEQFSMSCVRAVKKEEKKKPEVKKEEEKCLCKKTVLTAEDLKTIVTKLRKLDIRKIQVNPKDSRGNRMYVDKNGDTIPSTDRGRKPKEAVKLYIVEKDFSFYEDIAEDNKKNEDRLFFKKPTDSNIKKTQRNYADFAKHLNNAFKKFKINTCLRKIHFFAQIYHEAQRFTLTYEKNPSSSVSGGDDFRGRGLKQITHDYNYLAYYDYVNKTKLYDKYIKNRKKKGFESVVSFNKRTENKHITEKEMKKVNELRDLISTDLFHACNSAGWYWSTNKINDYADKDDLKNVSALVNNPSAKNVTSTSSIVGYDERKKYYDIMKIVFDYENCK